MKERKKIFFTVTNDLNYDQRMIRICTSLANNGFEVHLVGREMAASLPLKDQPFAQTRLKCHNQKGKLFYLEYNAKLYNFLRRQKADAICAIDLDTIAPCYYASRSLGCTRIFDSHELFCEMKEIVTRPAVYRFWKTIEQKFVPHFDYGYTVNEPIADILNRVYNKSYTVIRNVPAEQAVISDEKSSFILCQGAVNEARCFETLLPAMQKIDHDLVVCGDGNFLPQAKALASKYGVENKVVFTGMLPPEKLKEYTAKAYIGLTLIENNGLSNYLSLANRFFDYIQGSTPQVCVNFPAYKAVNDAYEVALMIDDTSVDTIAKAVNELMDNKALWQKLRDNCRQAAGQLTWENEEAKIIQYYRNIFEK